MKQKRTMVLEFDGEHCPEGCPYFRRNVMNDGGRNWCEGVPRDCDGLLAVVETYGDYSSQANRGKANIQTKHLVHPHCPYEMMVEE
jgi:hypothetical protein